MTQKEAIEAVESGRIICFVPELIIARAARTNSVSSAQYILQDGIKTWHYNSIEDMLRGCETIAELAHWQVTE